MTPSPPIVKGDVALVSAQLESDPTSKAAFATVGDVRTAVHRCAGPRHWSAGASAINADIEHASARDNRVIIPLVLIVVMIVLMVLLRAILSPLILIATVVLSFGAALGSVPCCSATCWASPGRTPRSRCSCSCSWSPWASTTTSS